MKLKMGRIRYTEQDIGIQGSAWFLKNDIARDPLVLTQSLEAIKPREVENLPVISKLPLALALTPVNGDTGIVSHLLSQTRQGIEKGGFSTIRAAHEG
jgi:hypothetical protein